MVFYRFRIKFDLFLKLFTLIPPTTSSPPRSVPTGAVRRYLPHRARGLWTPLRRLPPPRTAACPDPSVTLSDLEGVCVCRETYHLNTEKGGSVMTLFSGFFSNSLSHICQKPIESVRFLLACNHTTCWVLAGLHCLRLCVLVPGLWERLGIGPPPTLTPKCFTHPEYTVWTNVSPQKNIKLKPKNSFGEFR